MERGKYLGHVAEQRNSTIGRKTGRVRGCKDDFGFSRNIRS